MKNLAQLTLLLIFGWLLISCGSDEGPNPIDIPPANPLSPTAGPESVNFSAPVSGQRSKYVRYMSACGDFSPVTFTGDTLELTVTGEGTNWQLTERLTAGSPMANDGQFNFTHPYTLREDYALIPERFSSLLFWFYGNDTLFFNRPTIVDLHQEGCRLAFPSDEIFFGDDMGKFDSFRVGQIIVSDKQAVSCIPIAINVEAYLMYNSEHLSLSHTIAGEEIMGWLQIE